MKLGLVITGGGSFVISDLLSAGGASEYFSFAEIPYSVESSNLIFKTPPEKYGSIEASTKLAEYCLEKLKQLHPNEHLVAIGCSAVLSKKDQRIDRENTCFITKLELNGDKLIIKNVSLFINNSTTRYAQEYLVGDILYCIIFNKLFEQELEQGYTLDIKDETKCLLT